LGVKSCAAGIDDESKSAKEILDVIDLESLEDSVENNPDEFRLGSLFPVSWSTFPNASAPFAG
jgi:hypothetical protein